MYGLELRLLDRIETVPSVDGIGATLNEGIGRSVIASVSSSGFFRGSSLSRPPARTSKGRAVSRYRSGPALISTEDVRTGFDCMDIPDASRPASMSPK